MATHQSQSGMRAGSLDLARLLHEVLQHQGCSEALDKVWPDGFGAPQLEVYLKPWHCRVQRCISLSPDPDGDPQENDDAAVMAGLIPDAAHLLHDVFQHQCYAKPPGNSGLEPHPVRHLLPSHSQTRS